jgi:putative DNA primase/helicase
MLFKGWDYKTMAKEVEAVLGVCKQSEAPRPEVDKRTLLKKIWTGTTPIAGTLAEKYLLSRCPVEWLGNKDLRFHPELFCSDVVFEEGKRNLPALVVLLRGDDGKGCGIQATFLDKDGHKACQRRWNYGEIGQGFTAGPDEGLIVIAEGLETAMCAGDMFGAERIVATLSATCMARWMCPGVRQIIVAGDNDENYTGQAAAWHLANKLKLAGHDVEVMIPHVTGQDWADVWQEQQYLTEERKGIQGL